MWEIALEYIVAETEMQRRGKDEATVILQASEISSAQTGLRAASHLRPLPRRRPFARIGGIAVAIADFKRTFGCSFSLVYGKGVCLEQSKGAADHEGGVGGGL